MNFETVAMLLSFLFCIASAFNTPILSLGPTANLPSHNDSVSQLLGLVTGSATSAWPKTFHGVTQTNGALHVRQNVMGAMMSSADQTAFATAARALNLSISIEGGGAMCGTGSGATMGALHIKITEAFEAAGGTFTFWALESVFSRTHAGCSNQSQTRTAIELAHYAHALSVGLAQKTPPLFFLYDALPHFSVGKDFPPNTRPPNHEYGQDLETILDLLKDEMEKVGVPLAGYWMDCPYEYSRDYPNATAPFPAGEGWKKVAAAAALVRSKGLSVGKTFNSQQGGQTSDELFFTNTMKDWDATAKAGVKLDYAMVETWYTYPSHAAPESTAYTTTYTAAQIFAKATAE